MKKNKGFSLVELIIVIAIMAILAAAIAPALIRYIDKSRRADDVTAAGTINSSMTAALANEDIYDEIFKLDAGKIVMAAAEGAATWTVDTACGGANSQLAKEMNSSCKPPKIKYKKQIESGDTYTGATFTPAGWQVAVSKEGKPVVYIVGSGATGSTGAVFANANGVQLQPSIDKAYK